MKRNCSPFSWKKILNKAKQGSYGHIRCRTYDGKHETRGTLEEQKKLWCLTVNKKYIQLKYL